MVRRLKRLRPWSAPAGLEPAARPAGDSPHAGRPVPAGTDAEWPAVPGYEIRRELGRGGMGVVLRATDADFGRPPAVKVLLAKHAGDADLARRFLEEAQLAAQLQHPGVPPIHARGHLVDGRPYFAMKLVQGRTLAELLQERQGPPRRPAALAGRLRAGVPDGRLRPQ
jgi:serine/threonine protein kinase